MLLNHGRGQAKPYPGGQNLTRYPEGSNGGVHRGPDKFPRRNADPRHRPARHGAGAGAGAGAHRPSTGEPDRDAAGKPVKRKMKMAMVQDIVMAYQLIARNAAGP